jgi:hypothetical protein
MANPLVRSLVSAEGPRERFLDAVAQRFAPYEPVLLDQLLGQGLLDGLLAPDDIEALGQPMEDNGWLRQWACLSRADQRSWRAIVARAQVIDLQALKVRSPDTVGLREFDMPDGTVLLVLDDLRDEPRLSFAIASPDAPAGTILQLAPAPPHRLQRWRKNELPCQESGDDCLPVAGTDCSCDWIAGEDGLGRFSACDCLDPDHR